MIIKTVGELVYRLGEFDPTTPVVVSDCNYGDHSECGYIDADALGGTEEVRLWESGERIQAVRLA